MQNPIIGQLLEDDILDAVKPLVSIVMATYNSSLTVVDSIQSVLQQSITDFELLVIDNGSTDNTIELVRNIILHDSRVKLLLCLDKGASFARNCGIEKSTGEYIAFLDSDDLWKTDKLERQLNFMLANDIAISCTAYHPFSTDNSRTKTFRVRTVPHIIDFHSLLYSCKVGCSTVIFNREKLNSFMFPNINKEDYALWLNITKAGFDIYGFGDALTMYRVSNSSLSGNKFVELFRQWKIYRFHLDLSFTSAIYYIFFYTLNALLKRL